MLQVEILLPILVSLPFNLAARHELYTDGQLPKLMMQVLLQLGHCDYFNAKRYPETRYFPRIPEFYRENFFAKTNFGNGSIPQNFGVCDPTLVARTSLFENKPCFFFQTGIYMKGAPAMYV